MAKNVFKILKVTFILLIVVSLLYIIPPFTLAAIESMSSHRMVNGETGVVMTMYETTAQYDFESIDAMCCRLLGRGSYNQSGDWYIGINDSSGYKIWYEPEENRATYYMNKEPIRTFTVGGG